MIRLPPKMTRAQRQASELINGHLEDKDISGTTKLVLEMRLDGLGHLDRVPEDISFANLTVSNKVEVFDSLKPYYEAFGYRITRKMQGNLCMWEFTKV